MKKTIGGLLAVLMLTSKCTPSKDNKPFDINAPAKSEELVEKPSEHIDLSNKGVGPVERIEFETTLDTAMANKGAELFQENCLLCHKLDKEFVGPALGEVANRRRPEWIMNMILNPDGMLKEDSLAKALFVEFNGAPMSNQGLDKTEARAVLEYLRSTASEN